jgi:hypothetical protein
LLGRLESIWQRQKPVSICDVADSWPVPEMLRDELCWCLRGFGSCLLATAPIDWLPSKPSPRKEKRGEKTSENCGE